MKYSKHGYKRNSKDKNNPYNIIPSGDITMEGVDFPVYGVDNLGNEKIMMPGANYTFPGNEVFEVPLQNFPRHFKDGGSLPKAQDGGRELQQDIGIAAELGITPNELRGHKDHGSSTDNFWKDIDKLIGKPYTIKDPIRGNITFNFTEEHARQLKKYYGDIAHPFSLGSSRIRYKDDINDPFTHALIGRASDKNRSSYNPFWNMGYLIDRNDPVGGLIAELSHGYDFNRSPFPYLYEAAERFWDDNTYNDPYDVHGEGAHKYGPVESWFLSQFAIDEPTYTGLPKRNIKKRASDFFDFNQWWSGKGEEQELNIERKKKNKYDNLPFSKAFNAAEADGKKIFTWRGEDYAVEHAPVKEDTGYNYQTDDEGQYIPQSQRYGGSLSRAQEGTETDDMMQDLEGNVIPDVELDEIELTDSKPHTYYPDYDFYDLSTEKQKLVEKLQSKAFKDRYFKQYENVTGNQMTDEEYNRRLADQIAFIEQGTDLATPITYTKNKEGKIQTIASDEELAKRPGYGLWSALDEDFLTNYLTKSKGHVQYLFEKDDKGEMILDENGNPIITGWDLGLLGPDEWEAIETFYGPYGYKQMVSPDGQHPMAHAIMQHELSHLYNSKYSPMWQGVEGYDEGADYIKDMFGENQDWYSDEHASQIQEIGAAKVMFEQALSDYGIWDPNEGEFTDKHLKKLNKVIAKNKDFIRDPRVGNYATIDFNTHQGAVVSRPEVNQYLTSLGLSNPSTDFIGDYNYHDFQGITGVISNKLMESNLSDAMEILEQYDSKYQEVPIKGKTDDRDTRKNINWQKRNEREIQQYMDKFLSDKFTIEDWENPDVNKLWDEYGNWIGGDNFFGSDRNRWNRKNQPTDLLLDFDGSFIKDYANKLYDEDTGTFNTKYFMSEDHFRRDHPGIFNAPKEIKDKYQVLFNELLSEENNQQMIDMLNRSSNNWNHKRGTGSKKGWKRQNLTEEDLKFYKNFERQYQDLSNQLQNELRDYYQGIIDNKGQTLKKYLNEIAMDETGGIDNSVMAKYGGESLTKFQDNGEVNVYDILKNYKGPTKKLPPININVSNPMNPGAARQDNIGMLSPRIQNLNPNINYVPGEYTGPPIGGYVPDNRTWLEWAQDIQKDAANGKDLNWFERAALNLIGYGTELGYRSTSNFVDMLTMPSKFVAETTEFVSGKGDGTFNFLDVLPSMEGKWEFKTAGGNQSKSFASVLDPEGKWPLWLRLGADFGTDPTTYVGIGMASKLGKLGKVDDLGNVISKTDDIASINRPLTQRALNEINKKGSVHNYLRKYWEDPKFQKYITTEKVRNAREYNQLSLFRDLQFNRPKGSVVGDKFGFDKFPRKNPLEVGYKPTIHDKINTRTSFEDILNRQTKFGNRNFLEKKFNFRTFSEAMDPNLLNKNYFHLLLDRLKKINDHNKYIKLNYPNIPSASLYGRTKNHLDEFKSWLKGWDEQLGVYRPHTDNIYIRKYHPKDLFRSSKSISSTKVHEWDHWFNRAGDLYSKAQVDDLNKLVNGDMGFLLQKTNPKSLAYKKFKYYAEPIEIKARMMQMRHQFGLLPSDKFTMQHLKKSGDMFGMRPYLNVDQQPELFLDIMNKYYQTGGEETSVNFDDLEKGIKYAESLNGELMENEWSSASGYYGQLFSEIEDTYDGTREDFIADTDYQLELFKKRAHGEMENIPGLLSNGSQLYTEYVDQVDLKENGLTPLTIAALSNMLGRQGTRKYLGYVLRDGKTIEEVFPHLYGEDAEFPNHTPTEYIEKFNKGLLIKKQGGEFDRKIKRIKQQFQLYKDGKEMSPIAERELIALGMIKPRMQDGGSYTIKSGDRLGRIARDNNITLEELLKMNPQFMNNPSEIYPGQKVFFSEEDRKNNMSVEPKLKHIIKKGETLSGIASAYGIDWNELAKINNIKDPRKIRTGTVINIPSHISLDRNNKKIVEQEKIAKSPYNDEEVIILNDDGIANQSWLKREFIDGKWVNVEGKRNAIKNINQKENQAERIVLGINDNFTGTYKDKEYIVKEGDTLYTIAKNNEISLSKLMSDNNISNEDKDNIQVGQKLKITKSDSEPYLILDESKGRLHVYYPGENDPRYSYPVLTGAMSGDQQTQTKVAYYKDGVKLSTNQINEAVEKYNLDNVNELLDLPGYTSEVDWDMGNKITGAGIYEIDLVNTDGGMYDETGQGRSIPSFTFTNESGISVPMVLHGGTYDRRNIMQNIENPDTDRTLTNGCINGRCSDLNELHKLPGIGSGTKMYVLPEEAGNNFIYENGKINFYSSRENQQIANKGYTTEGGDYVEGGPGMNVTQKFFNYKPINITFDKEYYEKNSKRYDGSPQQEELEFITNTQPFLNAIVDNKKMMMEKLNIDGDLYNDLAMIAFGIYGYESGMGDINSSIENASKFGIKGASKVYDWLSREINESTGTDLGNIGEKPSPDVQSKYFTYGQRDEGNSVGWTQIRWNERDESELEALSKIGITDPEQLMDPSSSALATIAILFKEYQNQIPSQVKNRGDFDIFTALPPLFNKGKNYSNMVNSYMQYIDLSETDIDDLDNNLIVKGEYTIDARDNKTKLADTVDKVTNVAHKPEGNILGDVIDWSLNKTLEEKKADINNAVTNTVEGVKEWWNNVDLNPFWKLGGEFSLKNQNQFYNDYITGVYENTKQKKSADKLFDKINRMYYHDSKKSGMHQLDVLRKAIGSQSVRK